MYVDDFLLSGPAANMDKGWQLIRWGKGQPRDQEKAVIKMEEPTPIGKYLGAEHIVKPGQRDGKPTQQCFWDMSGFMQQCIDLYVECAQKHGKAAVKLRTIKAAPTPFLDIEDAADAISGGILQSDASQILMKILYAARVMQFDLLRPVT